MSETSSTRKRSLVVGASGQLGAQLVQQLGVDTLPAARRQLQPDWLHIDLEEIAAQPSLLDEIFAEHDIAAVYCAAGATDVERCESDHAWAASANHTGPLALARASRKVPFVFFSTDYVFDGAAGPYAEDAEPNPLSVYGRSKLDGERAILDAHSCALIIRTTTVYGPDPQKKNFLYTLRRLLTEGKTMSVPTDQFANPTYNEDLAAAAIALVRGKHTGLFHAAGPDFLPRTEFAFLAAQMLDLNAAQIKPVVTTDLGQKAARPLLGGLRSDKLQAALGADTMRSPATGIRSWIDSEFSA